MIAQLSETVRLVRGDCEPVLAELPDSACIVSDPPYGCANNCDYTRFTNGGRRHRPVRNDETVFSVSRLVRFQGLALFGWQNFEHTPPGGSLLVWIKKAHDRRFGTFLSDAEVAWINKGKGVYCKRHGWEGVVRETERGEHYHPTQKPVEVMRWLIERLNPPPGSLIVDPYMGSGPTGVAAVSMGFEFLGCELDEDYFAIARDRIARALEDAGTA